MFGFTVTDLIAAFLIALLSGMGVGSGGLLVVWLTAVRGVGQLTAQGINLLFFLISSGAALALHLRRRRLIPGLILLMGLAGIGGTFAGTALAHAIDPALIRKLFGAMLLFSGLTSLFRSFKARKKEPNGKVLQKDGKKFGKPLYK